MDTFQTLLSFAMELDRMKSVFRQTKIIGDDRFEDDAQHSYHISAMAVLLEPYAAEPVDLKKVLIMLLFHDVVELEAGDTFCYDEAANADKADREEEAAQRIYARLPSPQREELYGLWKEFEHGRSPEAQFAAALDRAQPVFNNYYGGGGSWIRHGVTLEQVLRRIAPIQNGSPRLYDEVRRCVDDAVTKGWIQKEARDGR